MNEESELKDPASYENLVVRLWFSPHDQPVLVESLGTRSTTLRYAIDGKQSSLVECQIKGEEHA